MNVTPPKVGQLRASIPTASLSRSTLKGCSLFLLSGALYIVTFAGCLSSTHLAIRAFCTVSNAICIALLFVVGHDACHGSLTSSTRLNQILGRLAFLPSWHPFACWDHGHNRLHHCWTNLRGKDYVWTPLTKSEFDRLPSYRRALERFYRSLIGVGGYYLIEVWLRHMVFPRPADRKSLPRIVSALDRATVAAYAFVQTVIAIAAGWHSPSAALLNIVLAIIVPQLLWNWLMGFVILLHHTHPTVRWYDDPAEWSFYSGQVQCTVHVEFPWPIGPMLHHIMEHTAHHIDPRIPLYNLPAAQRAVEHDYSGDVVISRFTLSNFLSILSQCQLYDYRKHCWLAFDGIPTTKARSDGVSS